ncbi:MAG: hydrolase TatD [Deltaproteobacteria bacterium HGW-Deltaproteobacteria-12]|jgi:TatD DNase family protein|nr:MAG: hydrolase TatD [Deltaproteobacteria bacterium HGW-Deltaproteobacteria-12]
MLIDSHAHLEMKEFTNDRPEVIERAKLAGVNIIVTVGTNLRLSREAVSLAGQYENIYASIGVHPHDVGKIGNTTYDELKELAGRKKVVAFGEIGLDFFRNIAPQLQQIKKFGEQLQLAKELHLPVIIHDREAHDQSIKMVKASGVRRGVFHCFSGDYEMAKQCLDWGFYLSVPGVVTYAKATTIQNVVKKVPLSSLLVETDCPYLAPDPYRGKRNEPAYVVQTVKKIAEIKGISREEVAAVTAQNTLDLFTIGASLHS